MVHDYLNILVIGAEVLIGPLNTKNPAKKTKEIKPTARPVRKEYPEVHCSGVAAQELGGSWSTSFQSRESPAKSYFF